MKAKVVSVAEAGFDGKDGRVPGATLTFLDEGGAEKTLTGYGPAMTGVLSWKEGEVREIEVFRPEGKDKDRFRLPREQKDGFGGGAAAYRNTKEGQLVEQDGLDKRTALMQAVEFATKSGVQILSAGGGGMKVALEAADEFYRWLRNGR